MYSNRGKNITFLIVPILTIFIKRYLFSHLGLITGAIHATDTTFTVTSIIYLIVGLIFLSMYRLHITGIIYKLICLLYIALFVYICAANMHFVSFIPQAYIAFLFDEMPLYALWSAMALMCLFKR